MYFLKSDELGYFAASTFPRKGSYTEITEEEFNQYMEELQKQLEAEQEKEATTDGN